MLNLLKTIWYWCTGKSTINVTASGVIDLGDYLRVLHKIASAPEMIEILQEKDNGQDLVIKIAVLSTFLAYKLHNYNVIDTANFLQITPNELIKRLHSTTGDSYVVYH